LLRIELEWNPFSIASKAARADRARRVREALSLYVRAGQLDRIERCLLFSLPDGTARSQLVRATEEWLYFWKGLAIARERRLPTSLVDDLSAEAEAAADLLWRIADNTAAALSHKVQTQRFQGSLRREMVKVEQLAEQLTLARADLADLELSGGGEPLGVEKTTHRLQELRQSVQDLREAVHEVENL
jgi:hypothetical protein